MKKARRNGKWKETNQYHESDIDLSEVGLRGSLKPEDFGWEERLKKERFTIWQNILVNHFEWVYKHHPSGH